MNSVASPSLGETWIRLVALTVAAGTEGHEGPELLGVQVAFPADCEGDALIEQFGDPGMVAEMRRVFFDPEGSALGHSYAALARGPGGRHDLQDVISLLRNENGTKRAVLTICGEPNSKVPCINVIQFLLRDRQVTTFYFARGQDAFKKFYADGICVGAMARKVADGLGVSAGSVQGFIGSSHVYRADLLSITRVLEEARLRAPAVLRGN